MNRQISGVPIHTMGAIRRYVDEGIPTGHFLAAVFSNDLFGAFGKADLENRAAMFDIVSWIYNNEPGGCHGSPERVSEWLARKHDPEKVI